MLSVPKEVAKERWLNVPDSDELKASSYLRLVVVA